MSCEFCKNADFGKYSASVTNGLVSMAVAGGSNRFPKDAQFRFCPLCSEPLTNPKPLTLDELREMDGEPVYILCDGKPGMWMIVDTAEEECSAPIGRYMPFADIGEKYFAYRWPTKEVP